MDWITGMQKAIEYIEENITEKLDYIKIAKKAYSSSFHFQRVFSIMCGYTIDGSGANNPYKPTEF